MKRFLPIAAVLLLAVLAWRTLSTHPSAPPPAYAAQETQQARSAAPAAPATAPDSADPELRAAQARVAAANGRLDASSAALNKFTTPEDKPAAAPAPAQAASTDIFGPTPPAPPQDPNRNVRFQSRTLRACPIVSSVPTAAQAAVLIQCTMDYETPQQMRLQQDISVSVGAPRKPHSGDEWNRMDANFPIVDLVANATVYLCGPVFSYNAGSNCDRYQLQNVPGVCWRTFEGGYRCQTLAALPHDVTRNQPAPTTF